MKRRGNFRLVCFSLQQGMTGHFLYFFSWPASGIFDLRSNLPSLLRRFLLNFPQGLLSQSVVSPDIIKIKSWSYIYRPSGKYSRAHRLLEKKVTKSDLSLYRVSQKKVPTFGGIQRKYFKLTISIHSSYMLDISTYSLIYRKRNLVI